MTRTAPRSSTILLTIGIVVAAVAACTAPGLAVAPTRSPVTTPTPAASLTPTPPPTARPAGPAGASPSTRPSSIPVAATWKLAELPQAKDAGQVSDVIARPGLVAAAAGAGPAGEHAIAWISDDGGTTWSAEPLPGPGRSVGRLVPWGDRILAVGVGDGDCAHPSAVEIWVRSSAGHWTAAPSDPIFCAGGSASAAASGPIAVIAGDGSGDVPYEWSSTTGTHWTDQSDVLRGRLPAGIAVDGSGFLVVGSGFGQESAWVSRSDDGTVWEAPRPIGGLADRTIVGDPVEFKGATAFFSRDAAGTVSIVRPDGQGGWRSARCDGLAGDDVGRIVSVGGSLLALGGDERGPEMWASADGTSWHAVLLPAEAQASGSSATLTGAAVVDGRAYLAGQVLAPTGGHGIGALWTGPAALLAP